MVIKTMYNFIFGKKVNPAYLNSIELTIQECDHNAAAGVGGPNCPFHLTQLRELANFKEISKDAPALLDLYYNSVKANAGLRDWTPSSVKHQFSALKSMLETELKRLKDE